MIGLRALQNLAFMGGSSDFKDPSAALVAVQIAALKRQRLSQPKTEIVPRDVPGHVPVRTGKDCEEALPASGIYPIAVIDSVADISALLSDVQATSR